MLDAGYCSFANGMIYGHTEEDTASFVDSEYNKMSGSSTKLE